MCLWNVVHLCTRHQSVPQLPFHLSGSLLRLWLLQGAGLPSSRRCRGWHGEGACSTARVFSSSSPVSHVSIAALSHLKGFVAPWGGVRACSGYKATRMASLCPYLHQWKGWSTNDLLDARNEYGPLPGVPGFPPGGKALVWDSFYLVALLTACVLKGHF